MCPFNTEAMGGQLEPFGSEAEGRRALDRLLTAMARLGYSPRARARVRAALQPALATALRCGPVAAPGGRGTFRYRAGEDFAVAEVEGWVPASAGRPLQGPHRTLGPAVPDGEPFRVRSYTWVRCDRGDGRVSLWGSLATP
jgi:hypothetical protein